MNVDIIQIGSNVGNNEGDPIWIILQEKDYSVIFIEPLEVSFNKLKETYKNKTNCYFENLAILDYEGDVDFYYQSNQTDNTKNNQQASIHKDWWNGKNRDVTKVKCSKLETLVEKYNMLNIPFYLLQIDAEGSDHLILLSTDFDKILPSLIRFESIHYKKDELNKIISYLNKFGYKEIPDTFFSGKERGYNTLLQKDESKI